MRKKLSLFLATVMLAGTLDAAVVLADEAVQAPAQPSVESVNEAAEDKASDTAQPNGIKAAALSGKVTSSKGSATYAQRNVTLTAAASGGETPLEYQFTEVYNGKTTVVRGYSGSNQYSFMTAGIGSHVYHVDIRDRNGQSTRCSYELNVLVHPDNLLSAQMSSSKGNATYADRSVTLSVQADGGYGDLEYQFTEVYGGKTTVLKDYSADNKYTFTTEGTGIHIYYADIRDSEGQSIRGTYQINVLAHPDHVLNVQVSSSKGSTTYIDRSVTLSAKAGGGYGDLEYQFTEVYGGKTTVLRKYSTDNAYEFSTAGVGIHTYHVDVRDAKGQSVRGTYKINIVVHPDRTLSGQVSSSKGNTTYVQRNVALTAKAKGGYGNLQYRFTEVYGRTTWVRQDYSSNPQYSFTSTGVGVHIYYIDIKDQEGQTTRFTYRLTLLANPSYKLKGSFTGSPSGIVKPGQTVTLTASSSGGYGNTRYQFRESCNGTTKILQAYSSSRTCTTKVSGVGSHVYYVDILDSESQILTLSLNINTSLAYSYATNVLNRVGWNLSSAFNWAAGISYVGVANSPSLGCEYFANYGFKSGTGDCYVMSAVFYYLAKTLGYDAHWIAGYVASVNGGREDHSWVEIDINGTTYVFDPSFANVGGRGYYFTYGTSGTWVYIDYRRMN